jgi:hypothetical protein
MTFFLLFGFSGYSNLIGNAMRSREGLSNLFESPAAQANNCSLSLATSLNMSISFSKCQRQVSSTVLSQVHGPLAGLIYVKLNWMTMTTARQRQSAWNRLVWSWHHTILLRAQLLSQLKMQVGWANCQSAFFYTFEPSCINKESVLNVRLQFVECYFAITKIRTGKAWTSPINMETACAKAYPLALHRWHVRKNVK